MKGIGAYLGTQARTVVLRDLDLEPREDQVLVRVAACGICRGDIQEFGRARKSETAFGHEAVGQVVARGPWVRSLSEGDWVVGSLWPGFSTHALAREGQSFKAPADIGRMGAVVEPLKCVTTVVRAAAVDFGDTVAVVGCGFMGLAAVAALAGGYARDVFAVDGVESRRELATGLGATMAWDPAAGDVVAEVRRRASGRGADAVIEFAGNTEAATLAARLVRPRGRLVVAGGRIPQADGSGLYDTLYISAFTTHYAPPMFSPDPVDDWRRAIDALARGRYPAARLVTHTWPLDQIQHALEAASAGDGGRYLKGIIVNDLIRAGT
jgi:threonine dehydrogenase-like Zn-dependent dehydrogenase